MGFNYFPLLILVFIFIIPLVNASDPILICLEKNQILKFSECNSEISDRVCDVTNGCKFCVNEIDNGVYCPRNLNDCNSEGLACTTIETEFVENNNNNNNNDNNNNNNNDNTPSNTNDNNNGGTTSNTNDNPKSNFKIQPTSDDELEEDNNVVPITGSIISNNSKPKTYVPYFLLFTIIEIILLAGLLFYYKKRNNKIFNLM